MNITPEQMRAQDATMLLQNPEFTRAFSSVEQEIIDALRLVGVTDEDRSGRDALILQLQLLTAVHERIIEVASELDFNPITDEVVN